MNKEVPGHRATIIITLPLARETSCSAFHTITRNRPCPTSRLSRMRSTSEFNNVSPHTHQSRSTSVTFLRSLKTHMVCDLTSLVREARFSLSRVSRRINIPIPRELMIIYSSTSKSYAFSMPPHRSGGMERIARNASPCHLKVALHVIQGKSHARKSAWI